MKPRNAYGLKIGVVLVASVATSIAASPATADTASQPPSIDTPAEALELAATDPAFEFVDGAVLVSEPPIYGPPVSTEVADAELARSMSEAIDHADALTLHSKPGADRVIFLDVDGHVITGTAWNHGRAASIPVGSYSREPTGSENETFSQSELDAIHDIWQRVAEDFAAWDVDVTTQDPGAAALRKDGSGDQKYGAHVVITHDSGWYAPSGGVAYIGAFGSSYYSPAFVFSNHLAQGSSKSVAEAASHEVGHNLGLFHDGQDAHVDGSGHHVGSTNYYRGHNDWAPIMGVGYSREITQWSKGQYEHADNTEDDLAKIDHFLPGRVASNGPIALPSGPSSTVGTLETGGGRDTYELTVERGPATVSLTKAEASGNLLAELVVSGNGTAFTRTIAPPSDPVAWTHSVTGLTTGTYTVQVRSIGYGSASDGFTDYASIGRYVLSVDTDEAVAPPPTTPPTTTPPTVPPPDPDTTTPPDPRSPDSNLLSAMSPVRLVDTRHPDAPIGRLDAGESMRIPVAGVAGVAADAQAAVVNVVAVNPSNNGFLSVTPCSDPADGDRTSSLNFATGTNIANSTIATLSDGGDICVYASAATDVVIDATGSIGPSGTAGLVIDDVRRIADSRSGLTVPTRLAADQRVEIVLGDVIDAATTAVALNVTAIRPGATGYLTIDDCRSSDTATAALNYATGETRGNNGIFALSSSQSLCIANTSPVDVTIDLTGEFRPGGLAYVPADPQRLLDTRDAGRIAAGSSVAFAIPTSPSDADVVAASVNIASANHPRPGYVTSWSCGEMPEGSALNPVAGQVTANGALITVSSSDRSCLLHDAGGDLIVDLSGWWV